MKPIHWHRKVYVFSHKMFLLIQQNNRFEKKEHMLKEEVTYYAGPPGQFEDEEVIYEVDIPSYTKEQGTDQCDTEDSSDEFTDLATEGEFVRLQRDLYQKYAEQKDLPQYYLGSHAYHISYYIHYCYCQQVTYRRGWRKY